MSLQRSLSWSAALRDMRNDRTFVAPPANVAERIARNAAREEGIRRYREARNELTLVAAQPLVTATGYDRRAIMVLANAIVRERMAADLGRSYRSLIGKALKQAWATAQTARRAAAH